MNISLARRFCLGITAVALTVAWSAGAASAEWPMFRHDLSHTGAADEIVAPPLKVAWSAKLGDMILSSPAVAGGVVYVGSRDKPAAPGAADAGKSMMKQEVGALCALNAKTGKILWKYVGTAADPVGWVASSPAVSNGVVYFTSRDGYLYAVDIKGKLKWRFKSGGTEMSSPTVSNGLVYFGGAYPNREVFAIDVATGKLKWKYTTGQMIYSSPAVVGGSVYIGSDDGKLYVLDAATGKEKWNYNTKGGVFFHSPLVADGAVYFAPGDYDRSINAVDLSTGKLKWKVDSDTENNYVSSAAIRDGVLFICSGMPDSKLYAVETKSGKMLWRVPLGATTGQMFASSPAASGKVVYVGVGPAKRGEPDGGKVQALEAATGKMLWEYKTDDPVISSPAVSNGMVYVGTLGGTLYAFSSGQAASTPKAGSVTRKAIRRR